MFRLTIDGQVIPTDEYDSLDDSEIVLRRQDGKTGRIVTSFAGNVKLYGAAAQIIYDQIINAPNGRFTKIPAEIFDTQCDTDIFLGEINFENLNWCYKECSVTCDIKERGFEADAINCLKSNFIHDNTFGFQQLPHNFVRHCTEMRPAALFQAFMYIGFAIHLNMYLLYPLILVISLIIILINAISNALLIGNAIDDPGGDGILDVWQELIERWDTYITGCGNGHPAPLVSEYIKNACQKCGLTFESTILNQFFILGNEKWKTVGLSVGDRNPYYNCVQLDAPVHKGQKDYTTWIDDNKPIFTSANYLEFVKTVWNADYRVQGNLLTFERKDAFIQDVMLYDASNPQSNTEENISLCFSFDGEKRAALGRFEFMPDGVDWVGNEAKLRFNDLIPFNTALGVFPPVQDPLYATFEGERVILIQASPQRYRRDGITEDVLSEWQTFFSAIGLADVMIDDGDDNNILLPVELTFSPKLIVLTPGTFVENAKATNFYDVGRGHYFYNKDMTFGAGGDLHDLNVSGKVDIEGNLYDRFHYINDPRIGLKQGKKYKLEIARCCETLIKFIFPSTGFSQYVLLPGGYRGSIEEVSVKSDRLLITGSF